VLKLTQHLQHRGSRPAPLVAHQDEVNRAYRRLIAAIVLGALLLLSVYGKLSKNADQIKTITGVGFPDQYIWALALCELAGALGVIYPVLRLLAL
jgi:uncharacterized membrane protein YphA (DoxX/SURF4 family)